MSVNVCVKLAAGLMVLTMLNIPAARPQNPTPTPSPAQSPASSSPSAAQNPGATAAHSAAPPAGQQAAPLPEYLKRADDSPDAMPRKYIQMWNTGDFSLMPGMFTAQPRLHYPVISSLAMPQSMVVNRIRLWRNCMPDLNYQVLDTIVQGDGKKVVLRLIHTGTYEKQCYRDIPGPTPGAPPVKIHANEILIFGLDHGKISDIWEQDDELHERLQMGAKWCNTTEPAAAPSPQASPAASPNPAPLSAPPTKP